MQLQDPGMKPISSRECHTGPRRVPLDYSDASLQLAIQFSKNRMYLRNFFSKQRKKTRTYISGKMGATKVNQKGPILLYTTHACYVCTGLTFYIGKITLNIYKKDSMSPTEKYFN